MFKLKMVLLSLLAFPSLVFSQESITITTYYPSPYGIYRELRAQRIAIGDNYINTSQSCWEVGTCPTTIAADADLVVEGNVGIGTTAPTVKLDVYGTSAAAMSTSVTGKGADSIFRVYGSATNVIDFGTLSTSPYAGFMQSRDQNNDGSTYPLALQPVGGNVGIGTTGPGAKLDVTHTGDVPFLLLNTTAAGNRRTRINFAQNGTVGMEIGTDYSVNNTNDLYIYNRATSQVAAYFNPNGNVWFNPTGNLGIGTTGPVSKLEIEGGKTTIDSTDSSYGQFQIGNSASGGEVSMGWISGVTGYGSPPTSVNGDSYIWVTGANIWGIGGNKWGIGNKGLSGSLAVTIQSDGNVGIGTTGPSTKLHVVGSSNVPVAYFTNSGDARIDLDRVTPTNSYAGVLLRDGSTLRWHAGMRVDNNFHFYDEQSAQTRLLIHQGTGDITGTYGNYHVSSDIRRKKDIVTIPNALEKVLSLRGVNFRWKDSKPDNNLHMGMIAQEVEKVVPEVVHTADDEMKTKAVEYQYVVGLLVEAMKAQQKEIEGLKLEIQSLKKKL